VNQRHLSLGRGQPGRTDHELKQGHPALSGKARNSGLATTAAISQAADQPSRGG